MTPNNEVLSQLVEGALYQQEMVKERALGIRVILADSPLEWGDIGNVRLDHEHGLLFGVHLIQPGDLLAKEPVWLPLKKLIVEMDEGYCGPKI